MKLQFDDEGEGWLVLAVVIVIVVGAVVANLLGRPG